MRFSSVVAVALMGITVLLIPFKVHSDVISGTGVLTWGEWDFSESASVYCYCGDISVVDVFDPPLGLAVFATLPPSLIVYFPDSSFQELAYAPQDTLLYSSEAPASTVGTYVVKTLEGNYAKFRFTVLTYQSMVIEYTYQPDGSRELFDRIATRGQSWGAIKALYR